MGIGSFIRDGRRILQLATKPSRKELWMSGKISVLAMFLVGLLSFGIQYLMLVLTANW